MPTTPATDGILTRWNDERGFGFISPTGGRREVFAHISAFPSGQRPQVGDAVRFVMTVAADGRHRAAVVRYDGHSSPRRRVGSRRRHSDARRLAAGAVCIAILIALVLPAVAAGAQWQVVVGVYAAASAIAVVVYAVDKGAAGTGRRRVSEASLHLIGAAGGWPGALLAQQALRHKTVKARFQAAFWVSVVVNLILLALVPIALR